MQPKQSGGAPRGSRRRAGPTHGAAAAVSFCTNLTAAAVTVAATVALLVLIADAFLLARGPANVAEECFDSEDQDRSPSIMASVPCHYLRLRPLLPSRFFPEVPDDGSMEDAACFIKVMLLAGAIVSCHYLLSCLLLLFGGIMRGCHTLFVPWLVAHALILVMLSMSAAAEAGVVAGSFYVSPAGWFLAAATLLAIVVWVGALVTWLEVKKMSDEGERQNYYRKL